MLPLMPYFQILFHGHKQAYSLHHIQATHFQHSDTVREDKILQIKRV